MTKQEFEKIKFSKKTKIQYQNSIYRISMICFEDYQFLLTHRRKYYFWASYKNCEIISKN